MQPDRNFKTHHVQRECVTPEIKRAVSSWTMWEAGSDAPFEIHYDRTVSFCVVEGRAQILFSNSDVLDIQKDDFVTIRPDIKGVWTVIEPLRNLYRYHESSPAL